MTGLDTLRAAQARARAALLDPKAIAERQAVGLAQAHDHEWRKSLFGRHAQEPPRPTVDDDRRQQRRRKSG